MKRVLCAMVALWMLGSAAQAALFSGPSGFSSPPSSQLGLVTNNLTLTDNGSGFVVSGQVIIAIPAAPVSGTLVTWTVDRPLDPTFGTGTLTTTTQLTGFSQPPVGAAGNTSGLTRSEFTNFPGVSQSLIPLSLVVGVDSPPWISLSATSAPFSYTSGGTNFLRQVFQLDGIYNGGPGGNWIVDVPLRTIATVVPEPSTFVLFAVALVGLVGRARRRRKI